MTRITTLTTILFAFGLIAFGQSSEIEPLGRQTNLDGDKGKLQSEICLTFAELGMLDSAKTCLSSLPDKENLSIVAKINSLLAEVIIISYYGQFETARSKYDSIFNIIDQEKPSFSIQKRAYLKSLNAHSYNVACETGLQITKKFIAACKQESADSLLMIAYTFEGQFLECLNPEDTFHFKSIEKAKEIAGENPVWNGVLYYELGVIHYYFERLLEAIKSLLTAESYLLKTNNKTAIFKLYHSFSDTYDQLNDFEKSKHYLLLAMKAKSNLAFHKQCDFYNVAGWTYYRLGEMDSALFYFNRSIASFETYCPGNPDIAYPLGNLGLIYRKLGKLDSSEYFSKKAKALFELMHYPTGKAEALNNLGFIAAEKRNHAKAEKLFEEALAIADDYNEKFEQMHALEGLIKIYKDKAPKKANSLYDEYLKLRLHFQGKVDAMNALQLQAEYLENKNQNRIRDLQMESEIMGLELERKNLRLLSITAGLIIALILAGLFYFYSVQHKKLMESVQESNEVNQRIISMISHDFRGPLNNIKLSLELVQSEDMDLSEFTVLAKDLYRQSSDVALMFDSFVGWAISQKDGYIPHKMAFKWSDVVNDAVSISTPLANLKNVEIDVNGIRNISVENDRMAISLILRNLLSNAIKYSHKGGKIDINFEVAGSFVTTKITDYGVGMSQEKLELILTTGDGSTLGTNDEYGSGLGLRMVINYVKGVNGSITATTQEGKGTSFIIKIPLSLAKAHRSI
ncbi:MAG: tetratricopeptide repeat-containing sensor histidine kinase [Salibacteraceae bacterium]